MNKPQRTRRLTTKAAPQQPQDQGRSHAGGESPPVPEHNSPKGPGSATFPPGLDKHEYSYAAAELLCDGYATKEIAKRLFEDKYKEQSSVALMWTKRLIHLATRRFLKLEPRVVRYRKYKAGEVRMTLSCVDDTGVRNWQSSVCRQAARELAQWIVDALNDPTKKNQKKIRIANAGGPTIQKMVQYLESEALLPSEDDAQRLEFASSNAAGNYAHYNTSGNYLSISMAEIYGSGSSHRVVLPDSPADDSYDLVICGVGTRESFYVDLLREHGIRLPRTFVGDIAFNPIDRKGNRVKLRGDQGQLENVRRKLLPQLDYDQCMGLAEKGGLWLVVPRKSFNATGPREVLKEDVLAAVLNSGLVSHCITGRTLWESPVFDLDRELWLEHRVK